MVPAPLREEVPPVLAPIVYMYEKLGSKWADDATENALQLYHRPRTVQTVIGSRMSVTNYCCLSLSQSGRSSRAVELDTGQYPGQQPHERYRRLRLNGKW